MNNKKNLTKDGFTLTEVIIAAALLGGLSLMIAHTVLKINSGTSVIINSQGIKAESRLVFEGLALRLFNTIRSSPVEDLFSSTPSDRKYMGIYGFAMGESYPWTSCSIEPGKFSIVRFTSIIPKTKTESTLRLWRENQASTTQLRLSRTIEDENEISGISSGTETTDSLGRKVTPLRSKVTEVLVIDGDSLAQRRYKITARRKVVTNRDPNSDLGPTQFSPTLPIYTYTELTLSQPRLINGSVPKAEKSTFISGSTVYAVKTSVFCVRGNNLVEIIENPEDGATTTAKILLDASKSQLLIARFHVTFATSTSSQAGITYSEFPISVGGSSGIGCVNALKLLLELRPLSASLTSNIILQKQILLGNHNENRPNVCL